MATSTLRDWHWVFALALFAGVDTGCGQVKNVLVSERDGGAGAPGADGAVSRNDGTGGSAGRRSGGGNAGAGGVHGAGTGSGTGSTPGSEDGGSTGAAGAPTGGTSSTSYIGPGLNDLDPHAMERRQLAQDICKLVPKNPCLSGIFTMGTFATKDPSFDCPNIVETFEYNQYGSKCWDEWAANAKCGIDRTDYCSCTGDDCALNFADFDFGPACAQTKAALDACGGPRFEAVGTETGKGGICQWRISESFGCDTSCSTNSSYITTLCWGPRNGGQQCECLANLAFLSDYFADDHGLWTATDCQDVARQLAAGKCTDILDCCFTRSYVLTSGAVVQECGCTADPKKAGYATCEALAAAGNGQVVDSCPQYRGGPHTFPSRPALDGGAGR